MTTTSLAITVTGWLLGWVLFWRLPTVRPSACKPSPADASTEPPVGVAVIVPARNEERALPSLLASVIGSDPRIAEVIVVDDGSADATATVAEAAGARVLRAGSPPPGFTGKAWACTVGARATSSPLLVFVDADVTFAPTGLGAVIDTLVHTEGIVSLEPYHRVHRAYERVSAFFGVVTIMGTGAAALVRGRVRGAFGPVLACRRADYDAVGGHAAEPGAIAEDLALAARFERSGLPSAVFGGGDQVSFRMYPNGPAQMAEGWTKNIATGATATGRLRLAGVALWVTAITSSTISLATALLASLSGDGGVLVVAALVALAFAVQLTAMFRQIGTFGAGTALAHPLLVAAFLALFARSVHLTIIRREVTWKGRAIPLHPPEVEAGSWSP